MLFAVRPFFPLFLLMPSHVQNDQDEYNKPNRQKHDQSGLALPNLIEAFFQRRPIHLGKFTPGRRETEWVELLRVKKLRLHSEPL